MGRPTGEDGVWGILWRSQNKDKTLLHADLVAEIIFPGHDAQCPHYSGPPSLLP